jgi:hypothetical protein
MKKIAKFKEEFVEELKNKIPPKVLELGLEFPKEQQGLIRLEYNVKEEFTIAAIYLSGLGKNNNITDPFWPILKFQYRDFHYVEPSFVFQGVYIRNGDDEIRYDSEMNVESRYIGHERQRSIIGNAIPNAIYKIESKGKKITPLPYHVFLNHKPPLPDNFSHEKIEKITENYDARELGIFLSKGHIKNNIMYLTVGNGYNVK